MAVKGKRTIWVGPADNHNTHPLTVEGKAVDAFLPGTLVERSVDGLSTSNNAATVFDTVPLVALEYGAHAGLDVDTAVTVGDNTIAGQARSGEFYNVLVAAGNNVARDAALSSNGDGSLKIAATDDSEQILFYADEAVNVTGSAALVCVRRI